MLERRGTVLVALVVALAVLSLVVTGIAVFGVRGQRQTLLSLDSDRATAAAEAAASLAVRELMDNTDHDGDGVIGGVSDDGVAGNGPTISGASVEATRDDSGGTITISARGETTTAARAIEITATAGASGSGQTTSSELFFARSSNQTLSRSVFTSPLWGSATTAASAGSDAQWMAAAKTGASTALLQHDQDLRYALVNASGTGTLVQLCPDVGYDSSRPFDVAVEGVSGEPLVVYYDKIDLLPRFRFSTGTTLSSEGTIGIPLNVAPNYTDKDIPWVRLVPMGAGTDEIMCFTLHSSGDAWAARWTGSAWTGITHMTEQVANVNRECMVAEVESLSGSLLAVFSSQTHGQVTYRTYNSASGWSSATTLSGLGSKALWMRMIAEPSSDSIYMGVQCEDDRLRVVKWNGSSWSAFVVVSTYVGSQNERRFDLAISPDGSKILLMYCGNGSTVYYRTWTGSGWSSQANAFTLSSGSARVVRAVPGPSGANIIGAVSDSNGGVTAWSFNGSTFGTTNRVGTNSSSYSSYEWFALPVLRSSGASTPTIAGWSSVEP